ncbi:MAG TPA: HipA family kinase [Candidatus Acidoferrales bacterium]|nr:HipA family kinase [Candidatus Acidoferrales bacterium]
MLEAIAEVRRMRGGAQAQMMRCSDGHYYVVKFANNPQGSRILANELLGGRLAELLGLPVARGEILLVCEELIRHSDDLVIQLKDGKRPCLGGLCFGSRFPIDPRRGIICDFLPDGWLKGVLNLKDFCGMLVFDVWVCNTDGRQVIYHREPGNSDYRVTMVDQGFCFNGEKWNFPDSPLWGLYHRRVVYDHVRAMNAFEPWLRRLENEVSLGTLRELANKIPSQWYRNNARALSRLVLELDRRRMLVRGLLRSTLRVRRDYFPHVTVSQAA